MKKYWLSFCLLMLFGTLLIAHPMGNFSISHYSALTVKADGILLRYKLDMAEIPTFQAMAAADMNGDRQISDNEANRFAQQTSQEARSNLELLLNGRSLPLSLVDSRMKVVPGAGGLPTFVTEATYFAAWSDKPLLERNRIEYSDSNYAERIGWKEIVIERQSPAPLLDLANHAYVDRTKQLTEYPADPTISPPEETRVAFGFQKTASLAEGATRQSVAPKTAATEKVTVAQPEKETRKTVDATQQKIPVPPAVQTKSPAAATKPIPSQATGSSRDDRFTRLLYTDELTGAVIFWSLMIAFTLGAFHALSPGHGKAIVAGYLVGSRGTTKHALFLGGVVTFTHVVGVFALGLVTLLGSRYVLPERLYPWLGFLSGVSIACIGGSLLIKRLRRTQTHSHDHGADPHHHHDHSDHGHHHDPHAHDHHDHNDHDEPHHSHDHHDHSHSHSDHSHHGHSHLPIDEKTGSITWKSLLTIGISGGALPCPSALVVLLGAISLHRVAFGLLLIVAFSLGLAFVLTSIGIMLVKFSRLSERFSFGGKLLYRLPALSSLLVAILGCAIAIQSLLKA